MKRYTISGTFEAESIADAFFRLGLHFQRLALGLEHDYGSPFPGPHSFTVEPEDAPTTSRAEAS